MRYLLIVSHATLAEGVASAVEMLMGPRDYMMTCCLRPDGDPATYRDELAKTVPACTAGDEFVVLGDIAGGYPVRCAREVLWEAGFAQESAPAFGGVNLPMAISAVMGIDDGLPLDRLREAVLAEGGQAVCEIPYAS